MADGYLKEYRDLLIATEQKAQESYDKTTIILSGGALAITLSLLNEFSKSDSFYNHNYWLFAAWISWVMSVTAILFSHIMGVMANRYALAKLDGILTSRRWSHEKIIDFLNISGGLLFMTGVFLISVFLYHFMEGGHAAMKKTQIGNQGYSTTTNLEEGHRIPPPPRTRYNDGLRPPPPPPPDPKDEQRGLRPPPPPPPPEKR